MKAKATREKPPAQFVPVKLEIILETQAELDALASLSNVEAINDVMRDVFGESPISCLYVPLQAVGGRPETVNAILAGLGNHRHVMDRDILAEPYKR